MQVQEHSTAKKPSETAFYTKLYQTFKRVRIATHKTVENFKLISIRHEVGSYSIQMSIKWAGLFMLMK